MRLWPLWLALGLFVVGAVSCAAIVGTSIGKAAKEVAASSSPRPVVVGSATQPATFGGGNLQHSEDVVITACAPDEAGWAAAAVTVTNHSSKASNYIITILMESPDGKTQIGTGLVSVSNLAPGQQSVEETSSLEDATGPYVCRVGDITRYAS
ncbi:hypothetical protein I6A84_13160 [Frankia sp. CNm7]|uniref:Uncharacterized protein n=1 Tax=Frankia nepalensis TaxID=1836974 RepID=A0A937RJY0_9ACTN|nr:hypothetical protein [Frankia nepalensis]MBL7501262.1 hypothetical protein [Frankia nepalensis]MBL7509460.1 hypothetical protein [Frankia nepalensis]MBL7519027.1 hypothetical protein [Frankia nepalensis]MBL7631537.1 hypothetical protein [Frankia nepalensis]